MRKIKGTNNIECPRGGHRLKGLPLTTVWTFESW